MKKIAKRFLFSIFIYIITYFLITFAKSNNEFIETMYSNNIYPKISSFISNIFGFFNFSFGEILLVFIAIIILYRIIIFIRKPSIKLLFDIISRTVLIAVIVNFVFWISWGLNNFRLPVDTHLDYKIEKLSVADLKETTLFLIDKINEVEKHLDFDKNNLPIYNGDINNITSMSKIYFDRFAKNNQFLAVGKYSEPKKMFFSEVMSNLNYTGIYNPFTSEPNINVNIPLYKIPFIATHEISHQRGIAGEREANFIAFITCIESKDYYFMYSAYLSGLIYVTNAIYWEDKELYTQMRAKFSNKTESALMNDAKYWQKFNNIVSEIGEKNNNIFLKSTGQDQGTKSYGLVVDMMAAYVKNAKKMPEK